jgi:hypothetical protein
LRNSLAAWVAASGNSTGFCCNAIGSWLVALLTRLATWLGSLARVDWQFLVASKN